MSSSSSKSDPNSTGVPLPAHQDSGQKKEKPEAIVYGVSLFKCDLDSIKPGQWFTDNIIHTYSKWLEMQVINLSRLSSLSNALPKIVILPPALVQLVKDSATSHAYEEVRFAFKQQELTSHDYIFAPLNTETFEANGGMHWTLLLFDLKRRIAIHFDSMNQMNGSEAATLVQRFVDIFLGSDEELWHLRQVSSSRSPQDRKGVDCGPIVCWLLKVMVTRMCKTDTDWGFRRTSDYWNFESLSFDAQSTRNQIRWVILELSDLQSVCSISRKTG